MVDRYPVFIERQNEGDSLILVSSLQSDKAQLILSRLFASAILSRMVYSKRSQKYRSRAHLRHERGNKTAISSLPSGSLSASSIIAFSRFEA